MFAEIALVNLTALATPALQEAACAELRGLSLPSTTVTTTELVSAGPYEVRQRGREITFELPAHCRAAMVLTPSADSMIEMELWLPVQTWNGKLLAVGNGGWSGTISFSAMAFGLTEGYAVASNDTGHKPGGGAAFAIGHPEKVADFAHRAMHEMTVQSKAAIDAFYEDDLEHSYYSGCSTGGRQGLVAAQRYPADFDAIIAGAPANSQLRNSAGGIQRFLERRRRGAESLPREKVEFVYEATVDACDTLDGVEDGLIADPSVCSFDPGTLLCGDGAADMCLTAGQVETVRTATAPVVSAGGELVYEGYSPGTELGFITTSAEPSNLTLGMYRDVVHQNAAWDWTTFDLDRDLAKAREVAGHFVATADLAEFKARGGKLLLYHGWSDGVIVPKNTVHYYEDVLQTMDGNQHDWIRLFMAPGMAHCSGGDGPNQVNWLSALERWNEAGKVPDRIIARRVSENGRVDMTRPLCPHPQVAKWTGVGSTNDAENFSCEAP